MKRLLSAAAWVFAVAFGVGAMSCAVRVVECRCACAEAKNIPRNDATVVSDGDDFDDDFEEVEAPDTDTASAETAETETGTETDIPSGDKTGAASDTSEQLVCEGPLKFKDPGFERVVRHMLRKPVGVIRAADVSNITSATMSAQSGVSELSDISPIKCFSSLSELSIEGIKIKNLYPLKHLRNLQSLGLASNQIEDISVVGTLATLTSLTIDNNPIKNFEPLKKLVNLTYIYLNNVGLKDASFISSLKLLLYAELPGNLIKDTSFLKSLPPGMMRLNLSMNKIKKIHKISGMPSIKELHLNDNQISDLSPLVWEAGNPSGEVLSIAGNLFDCNKQKKNLELLFMMWPNMTSGCPGFNKPDGP